MNALLLKGKLREQDRTQKDAADAIGLSLSRFNAKINGNAEFTLGEIQGLKHYLSLGPEQVDQIFFA